MRVILLLGHHLYIIINLITCLYFKIDTFLQHWHTEFGLEDANVLKVFYDLAGFITILKYCLQRI